MEKKFNLKSPVFKILLIFLSWRFIMFIISFLAISYLPLGNSDKFLGGGSQNYQMIPQFFSLANFDGEHYLSIAIFGYKNLEQAFFPVYPMLISFFSRPDPFNLPVALANSTTAGLLISNISIILAIIFLFELIRIDFPKRIAYLTLLLLLIFPTSYYFGSLYNESLFLLLSVLSFYSARKGKWFFAGVFGAIASATRVFGVFLFPALVIEAIQQNSPRSKWFWLLLIPSGLGVYMWYLYLTTGDPVAFYSFQKLVGEQHQEGIILLPQVYFRYLKMLATTSIQNPIFQTILIEFAVGILFFILPLYGWFKKIRLSYLVYAALGFLVPAVQGSFSSAPRYVLVLFPAFLAASLWFNSRTLFLKILIIILCFLIFAAETALFLRGYWVA